MRRENTEKLKLRIDLLEKLLSKDELLRISINKRFTRIRKQINSLLDLNKG